MRKGDIVQLDPEKTTNPAFAGCLMIVSEVHTWGVMGYVQSVGETRTTGPSRAYYRAAKGTFIPTEGKAQWLPADEVENEA
jgi:hypothetical protein